MLADQATDKTVDPEVDLVTDILEKRKQSETHLAEWTEAAKTWYGLASVNQWSDDDRSAMEAAGKPIVEFDRISVMVNAICGQEANNRQEASYLPRTIDDSGGNDLITDAAKWARDQCDAEDEESDAFRDTVICGYGWTETKMDYESDPEGMIVVSRRDPGMFHYDPSSIKRNLSNMGWVQCDDYLTDEAILARWPEAELAPNMDAPAGSKTPHDATQAPFYLKSAVDDRKADTRCVIHHCWHESEAYWLVAHQPPPDMMTGQIPPPQMQELSEDDYEVMVARRAQAGLPPPQARRKTRRVYKHAFVLGKQLLLDKDKKTGKPTQLAPCQDGFIYKCITGYRDRNAGTFYGLVKQIADPQRYANKMLSQQLHIINTNAKGGLLVEQGATNDIRLLEENWAKTDGVIEVNSGALSGGKIQPKPLPLYPQAIAEVLNFSVASIRDGSGVNLEMLGLADRNQPGVLEDQRTSAGMTVVATLFDSLRQYRKQQGRLLAHFIINYISDGRLIRITGPLGDEYKKLIRQPGFVEYDVIVGDAPTSRDMKAKTFQALMQLVPMVLQNGGPVPEEALDYAPIPSGLAKSWKAQIAAKKAEPPQPPPEVMVAQAVAQTEMAKVEQAKIKAQTDQAVEGIRLQIKQEELALKREEAQMRRDEHAMAMELAAMKLQSAEQEAQRRTIEHVADAFRPQPQGNMQ